MKYNMWNVIKCHVKWLPGLLKLKSHLKQFEGQINILKSLDFQIYQKVYSRISHCKHLSTRAYGKTSGCC